MCGVTTLGNVLACGLLGTSLLGCSGSESEPASATGAAAATTGSATGGAGGGAGGEGGAPPLDEWPNAESFANSDPWLAEHHAEIRVMRPKILALNFVNAKTNDQMTAQLDEIIAALREGSRYHAYSDPAATAMLEYEIGLAIDLRDAAPPANWPYRNSTKYPREEPVEGYWGFDYGALFGPEFAAHYGVKHPDDGHAMDLCELIEAGVIHEVWVYGDADVPDVSAAEILERKVKYGDDNKPSGGLDRCAGNGCFDPEDVAEMPDHCTRSIRIGWVNNTRGPGCYMESIGHGFERTGNSDILPYLERHFADFADFKLDEQYGVPFASWYACGTPNCITYMGMEALTYMTGQHIGEIQGYRPACGNVHVPPNGRAQYDYGGESTAVTLSTCEHFRLADGPGGEDLAEPFESSRFTQYNALAPDCGGGFHVYWMQSVPGWGTMAHDGQGGTMLPWWPFLYY